MEAKKILEAILEDKLVSVCNRLGLKPYVIVSKLQRV